MTANAGFRFLIVCLLLDCGITPAQTTQPRLLGTSTFGSGSVFSLNLDGTEFITHKTFSPDGDRPTGLTNGGDGFFYGMTTTGGSGVVGVIFKMKPDASQFSVIHEFQGPDGSQPAGKLLMASNGFLYGMTEWGGLFDRGVVFRMNTVGTVYQVLKHFDNTTGASPKGGLIETSQGNLVGMTPSGGGGFGVVFSIKLDGSNFNVIHTFNSIAGGSPSGTLLQLDDGLYGMTTYGGSNNVGTIFKIQADGSLFNILHQFDQTNGSWPNGDLILGLDNQLYGMTQSSASQLVGVIFKMGRSGANFTSLHDVNSSLEFRNASLVQDVNGTLYGTARSDTLGPNGNDGVLFKVNPDGSGFQFLLDVAYPASDYPYGDLMIDSNGVLFGIRKGLSEYPLITDPDRSLKAYNINPSKIYSFDPASVAYQVLKVFNSPEGSHPRSDLVSGSSDLLYGTTYDGGLYNRGVLYSIKSDGTGYQALYHFYDIIGGGPLGSLYRSSAGDIYGTAARGKILYRVHEDGTSFTTLYNFDDTPTGIVYYNGDFFGMTTGVPGSVGINKGTIFKIHEDGSGFVKLHTFNDSDGAFPTGTLTVGPNGTLYGMTMEGGSSHFGLIFSIAPDGSNYTVLMEFDGTNGKLPAGNLLFGADGTLFGMSYGDNANTFHSQVFNIYTDGNGFRRMAGTTGNSGQGNLIQAPSGELYGTVHAGNGATANTGYVFQINIDGFDFGSIHDQSWTNGVPMGTLKYADVPIKNQTIQFGPPPAKDYGDAPFNLTGTASSNLTVSYKSSDLTVATISGNTVTLVGIGTTAITASQPGNGIFNPATDVSQTLVVNKGNQVITFNTLPPKYFNDPPFAIPASINSGLAITYTSSDPTVATISGQTVTLVGIGTTDITASQAGDIHFNAASDVTQTLTVNKGNQVIIFNTLSAKTFGNPPFDLTATSNSGLTVTYSSTDPTVANVSGKTVTITGGGITTFIASQAGNNLYNRAPDATQTFTVNKVNQTLTFPTITAKVIGGAPFTLSASSSSGLAVQFSTTSDKITIAGGQATIVKTGSVTVKADQSGTASYNPAPQVPQTFCINPAKPSVTVTGLNTPGVTLTSSADTGNQWYVNGNIIAGATSKIFSPVGNGNFTVNVTVEGCVSVFSNQGPLIITGDISHDFYENVILFYPNPARDEITVLLDAFKKGLVVDVIVYDLSGKRLEQKPGMGGQALTLDVRTYSMGIYLIKASQEGKSWSAKFMKE